MRRSSITTFNEVIPVLGVMAAAAQKLSRYWTRPNLTVAAQQVLPMDKITTDVITDVPSAKQDKAALARNRRGINDRLKRGRLCVADREVSEGKVGRYHLNAPITLPTSIT